MREKRSGGTISAGGLARAQDSESRSRARFQSLLPPSARHLCAVHKWYNHIQQPCTFRLFIRKGGGRSIINLPRHPFSNYICTMRRSSNLVENLSSRNSTFYFSRVPFVLNVVKTHVISKNIKLKKYKKYI